MTFNLVGKIDIKYEISESELTPPPNFGLISLKIEKLVESWTSTTKTRNYVITGTNGDVSSILLWTYLHTSKFCSN